MERGFNEAQEERILKVIGSFTNEKDILDAWALRIEQSIAFPFQAEIADWQEMASIVQEGDVVKVHSIDGIFDMYGIIVNTRYGRKKVAIPLLDLEPINISGEQRMLLDDYNVWFSNR